MGRIFYTKHDLSRLGIHQSYMSSICGNMEKGIPSTLPYPFPAGWLVTCADIAIGDFLLV